ncbi:hypothetical protein [Sebaldella sp. S0638]|uniref:hypothetical protein n=1 Tax=Sebaldella sp. S0638 TaxID=2957809 RepID=UPI00209F2CDE|nr:hypothetical protein [Sebaldella sp. S0638]MCP1224761.1 hypothetical protein [Sebaldella sp. S0638]
MIKDISEINNIIQNKKFRLWKYSVSHRTLLLRAIENNKIITDLLFTDVLKIDIPTDLYGLVSIEAEQYDQYRWKHTFTQNEGLKYSIISASVSCYFFESADYSLASYFEHCI